MWVILKNLFVDELRRAWRRLLRRPAPPGDFSRYRNRLSPNDPIPPDAAGPSSETPSQDTDVAAQDCSSR